MGAKMGETEKWKREALTARFKIYFNGVRDWRNTNETVTRAERVKPGYIPRSYSIGTLCRIHICTRTTSVSWIP